MSRDHIAHVESIIAILQDQTQGHVEITPAGITLNKKQNIKDNLRFKNENTWMYSQAIGVQPRVHIVGAGHVSLALSELLSRLGFFVIVYDDRQELNTFLQNQYADEKHIVNYDTIGNLISGNKKDYLVIMTIGYRTDKVALLQLMSKQFKYVGMLGSETKIQTLFDEFRDSGIPDAQFAHVHAPIGLQMHSQTAYEIAVSIAAEIIQVKNGN
jgi:xanthine dehydrogenase accessory factor